MTRRRMPSIPIAGLGACLVLCGAGPSRAADMPPLMPAYQVAPVVQEFASGWYLRGDIGFRTNVEISSLVSNFPLPTSYSLDDVVTGGGGGGYKAQWLRTDITVDYAGKSAFDGRNDTTGVFTGKVESITALANLYVDLGSWGGITPYVGAGIGWAFFRSYSYRPPVGNVSPDTQSQSDLAWAYMAGVSFALAPRWSVDASYRRLNYGDITFNPNIANALTLKDLTANEFRLGVRYTLD